MKKARSQELENIQKGDVLICERVGGDRWRAASVVTCTKRTPKKVYVGRGEDPSSEIFWVAEGCATKDERLHAWRIRVPAPGEAEALGEKRRQVAEKQRAGKIQAEKQEQVDKLWLMKTLRSADDEQLSEIIELLRYGGSLTEVREELTREDR